MKRVRGVEEVPAAGSAAGASINRGSQGGGNPGSSGLVGGGGGGGGGGSSGGSATAQAVGGNLEYNSNSGGLGLNASTGQALRPISSREMPSSIQFGNSQGQGQYSGAIVVQPAGNSPVKVPILFH